MAEELSPAQEGRRIAREYLSKRGWVKQWRETMSRQIYPGFQREEFETKERICDQREEDAEEVFSREVEHWRRDNSPQAKEVLWAVLDTLGKRTDLGFFAKMIVDRLRQELEPF